MSRDEFVVPEERLLPEYGADGHVEEGSLHAWLDGAFDDDAAAAVAAHVAECATCRAAVAEARGLVAGSARVLAALDAAVPSGVVSPAEAARTASRIAAQADARAATRLEPRVAGRSRTPWWMGIAAAALVAVGGGTVLWSRGGETGETADVVSTESAPATQAGTALADAARADTSRASDTRAGDGATATATATSVASEAAAGAAGQAFADNRDGLSANADNDPRRQREVAAEAQRAVDAWRESGVLAEMIESARARTPKPAIASATPAIPAAAPATEESRPLTGESARLPVGIGEETLGAAQRMTIVVTGTVRDADAGQPIEGVAVVVTSGVAGARPFGSTTDRSGRFAVRATDVTRGAPLTVRARRIGYTVQTTAVRASQDTVVVDFRLSPSVNTLMSVVTSADKASETRRVAAASVAVQQVAASPAPLPAMGFTGRGIAGGIARGYEIPDSRRRPREPYSREQYDRIEDNPFLGVRNNPLSTFSIDVDRAAYANVRRFITNGQRPPADAVRIEELINYFPYSLPAPRDNDPVAITSEVIAAPWQPKHQLVRIALQATRIETDDLPPNNLVFLLDVSGSMMSPDKLPLMKQALRLLVDQLRPQDRVAIVTYAGAAGLVLPSTRGDEKARIVEALDRLEAGGSTAGGAGIELAYRTAREHFLERGNNRVILATDGDFNVGVSSDGELERLVERRRAEGTYLTVLGFGTGNYQASKMEKLAKVGNGNAAYIDGLGEARKLLVEEMGATLLTVANDVKLQVEFNPAAVQAYRLIGYENRLLRNEDFADDTKDAGDIGAGHQVTALYEVVPVGVNGTVTLRGVDSLRYRTPERLEEGSARRASASELLFVKLRYKRPGESQSRLLSHAVSARSASGGSQDMRFIASVASFGMLLRDSEYQGNSSAAQVLEQARAALGNDMGGYRAEFVRLVERWRELGFTSGERR